MAAVEPDVVLCRGLGGLPRSTSTTRRVYQGLGDPASHPLSTRARRIPHDSPAMAVAIVENLPVLHAVSCTPKNFA